jgi:hypothetical protein
MQTIHRSQTLFVGIDVHKDTHTAVGLTPFGEKVFEIEIGNEAEDFISLVKKTKVEAEKNGTCSFLWLGRRPQLGRAAVFLSR